MAIESAVLAGDTSTAYTIVGVVKPTAANTHAQSVRWLCLGGETSGNLVHFLQLRPYDATPEFSAAIGQAQTGETSLTSGITTINGVTAVLCLTYNGGGNAELFVNGESEDTGSDFDVNNSPAAMDGHVFIGDQKSEDFRLEGLIGDCLIYSRVLTSGELTQVTDYLLAKYGV
jgi:hypothetical protein